jgi:hypothetical protein
MPKAATILCLIVAGALAAGASANKPGSARCWTTPSQVAVGESYTIAASGLPSSGPLNLIVVYPNGNALTSPVTSTDGSYSLQPSGSAFAASDAGTYTYKFVGKVSWPSGDTNKIYATCSMQAS